MSEIKGSRIKKWIVAAGALLAWALRPFEAVDAGSLYVVDTLALEMRDGRVIAMDGTAEGSGATVKDALTDMAAQTPGILFLRQTRRIIFCGENRKLELIRTLPEEIPMGTFLYQTAQPIERLKEDTELNDVLTARETEGLRVSNLAQVRNRMLLDKNMQ